MTEELDASVLGPVRLRHRGAPVPVGGRSPRAIVAMLLLNTGRVVSRDRLIDGLWGDDPPSTADATIQSHISRIRRSLATVNAAALVQTDAPGYRIELDDQRVDLRRFERAAADGRAAVAAGRPADGVRLLQHALAQWSGPALADLDGVPFAAPAAARLAESKLSVTEDAYEAALDAGDSAELVPDLRRLITDHPLRERLRAQLMLALYRSGRQADALEELRIFKALLDDELGLRPGPDLVALERDILSHAVVAPETLPAAASAPASAGAGDAHREPLALVRTQIDTFVGRQAEIASIEQRLADPSIRLVTLTGPGGAGKTRLADEIAVRWTDRGAGAVAVVALDSLGEPDLVTTTVARAVGVDGAPSLDAIVDLLGDDRVLLVLDNMEHLLPAVPLLAELLARVPNLALLVTSRVSLRLPGEHEITVPPLHLPVEAGPEAAARSDGVQLFVARAQARTTSFVADPPTMTTIAELVRLLDGLPLAIELAAARIKVLPPAAMLARMQQSLDVVGDPGGHRADRQRTLRSTLEWSVRLVPDDLVRLFSRLAVFAGRFDMEDAVAIAQDGLEVDVIEGIELLVDHSLLQRTAGDSHGQFGLLRTVRSYARELLDADPSDAAAAIDRRDRYFAERVSHHGEMLLIELSDASASWIRRHTDDLRAVLDSASSSGDAVLLVRVTAGLAFFWALVQVPATRRWILRALDVVDPAAHEQCAKLHSGLARLAMFGGSLDEAGTHARDVLACVAQGAQPRNAMLAHNVLGQVAAFEQRWDDADGHAAQAMELAERETGGALPAVMTRIYRADMLLTRQAWEQAATVSREVLDQLADHTDGGGAEHANFAMLNLALAYYRLDELHQSRQTFAEAARLARRLRSPTAVVVALLGHAALAATVGRNDQAAELLVASDVHAARHQIGLGVPERRLRDDISAAVDTQLSASEIDAIRQRVRATGVSSELFDLMEAPLRDTPSTD